MNYLEENILISVLVAVLVGTFIWVILNFSDNEKEKNTTTSAVTTTVCCPSCGCIYGNWE